jgi:hypothetical protein
MNDEKREEGKRFDPERFREFLNMASEEVRSWPAWKQAILSLRLPQTKAEGTSPKGTSESPPKRRAKE